MQLDVRALCCIRCSCALQTENLDEFNRVLERTTWGEWALDVMAKPREYKGVAKMRINVRAARRADWDADSGRLLQMLAAGRA